MIYAKRTTDGRYNIIGGFGECWEDATLRGYEHEATTTREIRFKHKECSDEYARMVCFEPIEGRGEEWGVEFFSKQENSKGLESHLSI